jgi:hypothetical protein
VNPLLLLSLGAVIVSTASSVTPVPAVGPPNPTSAPLGLDGGCGPQDSGPWLWNCVFLGSVWDPTLVFFRWDFNGDGIWDFPWTTDLVVGHQSSDIGVIRVILQGWDGVSTLNGEPTGPVAGKDLVLGNALEFGPARVPAAGGSAGESNGVRQLGQYRGSRDPSPEVAAPQA